MSKKKPADRDDRIDVDRIIQGLEKGVPWEHVPLDDRALVILRAFELGKWDLINRMEATQKKELEEAQKESD